MEQQRQDEAARSSHEPPQAHQNGQLTISPNENKNNSKELPTDQSVEKISNEVGSPKNSSIKTTTKRLTNVCGVCLTSYVDKDPILLGCLHIFCSKCILHRKNLRHGNHSLIVKPEDKTTPDSVAIPDSAFKDIDSYITFVSNDNQCNDVKIFVKCPACECLSNSRAMRRSLYVPPESQDSQGNSNSDVDSSQGSHNEEKIYPCTSCDDSNPAINYCAICNENLCVDCVSAHKRVRITKDHKLEPVKKITSAEIDPANDEAMCTLHPSEPLKLFCESCLVLTCRDCQLTSHRDHKYKFIDEAAESERRQLMELNQKFSGKADVLKVEEEKIVELMRSGKVNMEEEISRVKDFTQQVVNSVNKTSEFAITKIKNIMMKNEEKQMSQLNLARRLKTAVKHSMTFIEMATLKKNGHALLQSKSTVVEYLNTVLRQQFSMNNIPRIKTHFIPNNDLPTLVYEKFGKTIAGAVERLNNKHQVETKQQPAKPAAKISSNNQQNFQRQQQQQKNMNLFTNHRSPINNSSVQMNRARVQQTGSGMLRHLATANQQRHQMSRQGIRQATVTPQQVTGRRQSGGDLQKQQYQQQMFNQMNQIHQQKLLQQQQQQINNINRNSNPASYMRHNPAWSSQQRHTSPGLVQSSNRTTSPLVPHPHQPLLPGQQVNHPSYPGHNNGNNVVRSTAPSSGYHNNNNNVRKPTVHHMKMNPRFVQPTVSKHSYRFHTYPGMNSAATSKSPIQQVTQQQAKIAPQQQMPLRPVVTQQQRPLRPVVTQQQRLNPVQPVIRKQPIQHLHGNPSSTSSTPTENSSNRRKASEPRRYTQQDCITRKGNITVVDVGDYDIDPFSASNINGMQRSRTATPGVSTQQTCNPRADTKSATPPNRKMMSSTSPSGSTVTSQNKRAFSTGGLDEGMPKRKSTSSDVIMDLSKQRRSDIGLGGSPILKANTSRPPSNASSQLSCNNNNVANNNLVANNNMDAPPQPKLNVSVNNSRSSGTTTPISSDDNQLVPSATPTTFQMDRVKVEPPEQPTVSASRVSPNPETKQNSPELQPPKEEVEEKEVKQEVFSGISPCSSSMPPTSVSDSEAHHSYHNHHGNKPHHGNDVQTIKRSVSQGGRSSVGMFTRGTRSVSNDRISRCSDKGDDKNYEEIISNYVKKMPTFGKVSAPKMRADDPNDDYCGVCSNGGDLVCCDTCPKVFHLSCHVPNLPGTPQGNWQCTFCTKLECDKKRAQSSSTRGGGLSGKDLKLAEKILLLLYCHPDSTIFHKAVKSFQAPNYYKVITRPIDLSKIKRKLAPNLFVDKYECKEQFVDDVMLMLNNCMKFNGESSNFGSVAMKIHRYFRNLVRDLFDIQIPDLTITNIKLLINELEIDAKVEGDVKKQTSVKRKVSSESVGESSPKKKKRNTVYERDDTWKLNSDDHEAVESTNKIVQVVSIEELPDVVDERDVDAKEDCDDQSASESSNHDDDLPSPSNSSDDDEFLINQKKKKVPAGSPVHIK